MTAISSNFPLTTVATGEQFPKEDSSLVSVKELGQQIVPNAETIQRLKTIDLWLKLPISNSTKHYDIVPPLNDESPIAIFGIYDQFLGLPHDCAGQLAKLGRSAEYNFLSNFYPIDIEVDGRSYRSAEHYYQAIKFPIDSRIYNQIVSALTAKDAHRIGVSHQREASLGHDAMMAKRMKKALCAKFVAANGEPTELGRLLLATGDRVLIEGNRRVHSNTRWGAELHVKRSGQQQNRNEYSFHLQGQNMLGELLMEIRRHLNPSSFKALPAPV